MIYCGSYHKSTEIWLFLSHSIIPIIFFPLMRVRKIDAVPILVTAILSYSEFVSLALSAPNSGRAGCGEWDEIHEGILSLHPFVCKFKAVGEFAWSLKADGKSILSKYLEIDLISKLTRSGDLISKLTRSHVHRFTGQCFGCQM